MSYLNTKPLIYGFEQGMMKEEVDWMIDYPSNIAELLQNGQVDIGLVPVAVIPTLKEYHIISDFCIGCDGEVVTVCLFSDVPLAEIETILLDYQSLTSVALLKILLKAHWNISPNLVEAKIGFEKEIHGKTAGLVIGDRAFQQRKQHQYIYDLGTAWKEMTGLPFVFAAWVANKKLPEEFVISFNNSTAKGFEHINEISAALNFQEYDMLHYYNNNINYRLDNTKQSGLELFLKYLKQDK